MKKMQKDNELVIDTSNKTMYTKTVEEMRYINSYGYSVKCKIRTMRRKNYSTLSLYPVNGCTRVSEGVLLMMLTLLFMM